ncbi:MAG: hypothetical protein ICV67_00645 [Thermoleophilia bacterium]|nr:hypothetical protein [Thermoleophilia bacterium]
MRGKSLAMLAAALALVVVGILFLFVIPWAGLVVGPIVLAAGIVLAVVYVMRRPARRGA